MAEYNRHKYVDLDVPIVSRKKPRTLAVRKVTRERIREPAIIPGLKKEEIQRVEKILGPTNGEVWFTIFLISLFLALVLVIFYWILNRNMNGTIDVIDVYSLTIFFVTFLVTFLIFGVTKIYVYDPMMNGDIKDIIKTQKGKVCSKTIRLD